MQRHQAKRVLATVYFTDIVNSTVVAEELGDARWKELLDRHHHVMRRELKRFGGKEIDTAGEKKQRQRYPPSHLPHGSPPVSQIEKPGGHL